MKQCNFQNNYGTIAQRKVSSCAPIFKFLYGPPQFFLGGKFIQKCYFWRFWRQYSHIFKATMAKVRTNVGTWETLPAPNFVKKLLKGIYRFWPNIYQKLIFVILGALSPHFLKLQRKNLA